MFVGHGNPMNTFEDNVHTRAWRELGDNLPRPKAILAISAHWYTNGTAVTAMDKPRTIHDFHGFPPELFAFDYPAPGDAALARRIAQLLAPLPVAHNLDWGLDHGTWSVLAHLYPRADIPVVQLSIDSTQSAAFHYGLGQKLQTLREQGVLILASGNVVHNLREADFRPNTSPPAWAQAFEERVRQHLLAGEVAPLIAWQNLGENALRAIPTPEHYLPLLYVLGARIGEDRLSVPTAGVMLGAVSMLSVLLA
jgi:4,5-DOPA dioxygenase extradiol